MSRFVLQINAVSREDQQSRIRSFSEFVDHPAIILLGDPGAGKTYLFRKAAETEGARLISARSFLVIPPQQIASQTLFIDGLDEKRAGRTDRDTVDALVTKLFTVNPAKVRVSCRVADWLGESDLSAFRPYFEQHGEAPVLLLQSLSRQEQVAVLAAQGVAVDAADTFLAEAIERGLDDFLENPQNLIMLWRAVQTGSWPATRRELFELSTKLMLQEFDQDRARSGSGSYSVAELRPVAGALCAARLISDVAAISLIDQEGGADIPGYRSVTFFPPEKVMAALGRRIFDAGRSEEETVDYSHRTTAEFLAAEFLANRVREGLPFGRVVALMGVDSHPAAELRGLHAWLAVHLLERADELIEADPYGVLTYGDAASLTPSSCACLLRALDRLAANNPWFRSGHWQSRAIGGLARSDMVGEFRAILHNPASGSGIRSVVVDALSLGPPIPEMLPDLASVLARQTSPDAERAHALAALLRLGDAGKAAVREVFKNQLDGKNDVRLQAEILMALYGEPYGAADVVSLVNNCLDADDMAGTGLLWMAADKLPSVDLPAILDDITPPKDNGVGFDRRHWEVTSFYARILVRAWREFEILDPERALAWLNKRAAFKRSEGRARDLRAAMAATPELLTSIARHFFRTVAVGDRRWLSFHRFREASLFEPNVGALLDVLIDELGTVKRGSDRQLFFYEIALALCYQADQPHAESAFAKLWSLVDTDARFPEVLLRATVSKLPDNYFEGHSSRSIDAVANRERQRREFDEQIELIRSGRHIGWLRHLSLIYFAQYSDVDRGSTPHQRIAAWLGEERVQAALEGLIASLLRDDLPSFAVVMELTADHKHYDWWWALVAGLNERLATGQNISDVPDDLLQAMLAFDITNPVSEQRDGSERRVVHPWRKDLMESRPELVRDTYLAVVQLRLSRNEQFADGLSELLTADAFKPYLADIVLGLLSEYPNASPFRLDEMLNAAAKLPAVHERFLGLTRTVLADTALEHHQRDLWLATAYVLSHAAFENDVRKRAAAHPAFIFDLRDKAGFADQGQPTKALPSTMLEFLAQLAGSFFPDTPYPSDGWGGNTNGWDAAEWVRALIGMISASPSEAATAALKRLRDDNRLTSYRPSILHALANQRQRRRDAEYDRPDWPQTIAALSNGPRPSDGVSSVSTKIFGDVDPPQHSRRMKLSAARVISTPARRCDRLATHRFLLRPKQHGRATIELAEESGLPSLRHRRSAVPN